MATRSTASLNDFADQWEDDLDYPSAVLSGIVGDARHRARGGYHISIEDNPAGNYSIVRKDDAAPPGNWPRDRASAVDMSMSKADMVKCYKRVHAVWADHSDPRRKYFNAFNVWDGSGDAVRLDFVTNRKSFATSDHKWHNHGEFRRRYVNSAEAMRAGLSMLAGESAAQYLGIDTVVPVPAGSPLLRRQPMSTGSRVRQLQRALNEAIDAGLKIDGAYGRRTEAAVEAFQRHAGLGQDGIYGPNTAAALRDALEDDVSAQEVWAERVDANEWVGERFGIDKMKAGIALTSGYGHIRTHRIETRERDKEMLARLTALDAKVSGEDVEQVVVAALDAAAVRERVERQAELAEFATMLGPTLAEELRTAAADLPTEAAEAVAGMVEGAVERAMSRVRFAVEPAAEPAGDES